jgi:hypothetical protein
MMDGQPYFLFTECIHLIYVGLIEILGLGIFSA